MKRLDIRTIAIDDPVKVASDLRTKTAISEEDVSKVRAIMNDVMNN